MAYIRKRKRKKTEKVYYTACFKDQWGKWHEESAGPLKRDAEALLKRRVEEVCSGTYGIPPEEDPLFGDYSQLFLEEKTGEIEESTHRDYRSVINKHLNPYFKDYRLSTISPKSIRAFLRQLDKTPIENPTRRKIYRVLKVILRHALASELIKQDPTIGIKGHKVEIREMDFLDPIEIGRLLEAASGFVKVMLAIATLAGLRPGEILALKWKDIDLDTNYIHVQRSFDPRNGISGPKTYSSRRAVEIIPTLQTILTDYYEACGRPDDEKFLFANRVGNPLDRRNFTSRHYGQAFEDAGLKRVEFRELRHSFASLCLASGMDVKVLQRAMGHSSVKVTMDIYCHLIPNAFGKSVDRIEELISLKDNNPLKVFQWPHIILYVLNHRGINN